MSIADVRADHRGLRLLGKHEQQTDRQGLSVCFALLKTQEHEVAKDIDFNIKHDWNHEFI